MKGKTLLSLAIVISMLLSVLPLVAVRASPTDVKVVFENDTQAITKSVGSLFRVDIEVFGAPEITQWIIELTWDSAVLELEHAPPSKLDVKEGDFLNSVAATVFLVKPTVLGGIPEATSSTLDLTPNSGDGLLMYVLNFKAKAPGVSPITLVRHILIDGRDVPPTQYANTAFDGTVTVPAPPATPPDADILTPADGALVPVCNDVILDGSTSTDGYDTLPPPGESCPITEWKWEIDIGNDGIIDLTLYDEVTSFHCDGPGVVKITLTVTAPDPTPPAAGSYVDHNSESHLIMQVTPSVGAAIDVYTDRNGIGPLGVYPFGWSDAYGPQEEVCVYAKVTYNDEPVEYKPVGFEVIDPFGESRDYRVAFTDADGIATVCFRIPWEGSDAEDFFGVWSIVGTVDVAGTVVSDTVKFKFGYILSINAIYVHNSPLYKGDILNVDVDINSISMVPHDAFLTIVACDEPGVPVGLATAFITVDAEDGWEENNLLGVHGILGIPSWAFVGTGTIYVNLFTAAPSLGGVPYCPEETAIFIILKTP